MQDVVSQILDSRPSPDESLEQFLMDKRSSANQARYLASLELHRGIVFLGDDDHLSVLLARLRPSVAIRVIEVDNRIVRNIEHWSQKLHLRNLELIAEDLRSETLQDSGHSTFYANPPWSSKNAGKGLRYWVSRGIDVTTPASEGVIAMPGNSEYPWIDTNWITMQSFLTSNGCRIVEIDRAHRTYEHTNDPGLFSVNIRFKRVRSNLRLAEPIPIGNDIYR